MVRTGPSAAAPGSAEVSAVVRRRSARGQVADGGAASSPGGDQDGAVGVLAEEGEGVVGDVGPAQPAPAQGGVLAAQPGERGVRRQRVVGPSRRGRCHGIGRRESSPSTPSSPISSPANTIGTPGRVNCRPAATRCTAPRRRRRCGSGRCRASRGCSTTWSVARQPSGPASRAGARTTAPRPRRAPGPAGRTPAPGSRGRAATTRPARRSRSSSSCRASRRRRGRRTRRGCARRSPARRGARSGGAAYRAGDVVVDVDRHRGGRSCWRRRSASRRGRRAAAASAPRPSPGPSTIAARSAGSSWLNLGSVSWPIQPS